MVRPCTLTANGLCNARHIDGKKSRLQQEVSRVQILDTHNASTLFSICCRYSILAPVNCIPYLYSLSIPNMSSKNTLRDCDLELVAKRYLIASQSEKARQAGIRPFVFSAIDLNRLLGFHDDEFQWGSKGLSKHIDHASWDLPYLTVYKHHGQPRTPCTVRRRLDLLPYLVLENGRLVCNHPSTMAGWNQVEGEDDRTQRPDCLSKKSTGTGCCPSPSQHDDAPRTMKDASQAKNEHDLSAATPEKRSSSLGMLVLPESPDTNPSSPIRRKPCPSMSESEAESQSKPSNRLSKLVDSWEYKYRHARLEFPDLIKAAQIELEEAQTTWTKDVCMSGYTTRQASDRCLEELARLTYRQLRAYKSRDWDRDAGANELLRLAILHCWFGMIPYCWSPHQTWPYIASWAAFFVPLIAAKDRYLAIILELNIFQMRQMWLCDSAGNRAAVLSRCGFDIENLREPSQRALLPAPPRDLASYEVARQIRDYLLTSEASVHSFSGGNGEMYLEFHRGSEVEVVTLREKREEFVARNAGREIPPANSGVADSAKRSHQRSGSGESGTTVACSPSDEVESGKKKAELLDDGVSELEVSTLSKEYDEKPFVARIRRMAMRVPCFGKSK